MTTIIAEIGVNWDGNFNLVKEIMSRVKEAGCDAVKFQAFDEKIVQSHPQKNRLLKSSISKNNIETIHELAKKIGIEWFCTPMYVGAIDLLEPYVSRYKIREVDGRSFLEGKSSELIDLLLKTGKDVIVSTQQSPKNNKLFNEPKIQWLYCVPKYPCDLEDLDFTTFSDFDGYSNHCPHIIAPLTSVVLGGKIVEFHITSNKTMDFIDNNISFDYEQMNVLIKLIRLAERIKK
jgi:sialic acid synthase SpsE